MSAVFGSVLAVLFVIAAWSYSSLEARAADDELATVVTALVTETHLNKNAAFSEDIVHTPRGPSAALFDAKGNLVRQIGSLKLDNVKGRGLVSMRGYLVRYVAKSANGLNIVVGDNWQDVQESQIRLWFMLGAIWLPLTAGVAIVTWLSVTRTFRPLLAMAEEAERLSATGPGSRLAVPEDMEFGPLASRLNAFLDRLESNVRTQERFVADAAHELRTPLTILRGQAETALLRERSPEEYTKVLAVVVEESARLADLVNSLLVSSSVAKMPSEPQELAVVVQESVDRWRTSFKERGVALKSSIHPCLALVNEREVDTVLNNLLANALRHSPEGSTCTVELKSDGGLSHLIVSDAGPGITDASKGRVFDRFYRTDAGRNRAEGGFGIGLSICHRIVTQTGGEIHIEDNAPKGTRFVVTWPTPSANFVGSIPGD